MENNMFRMAQQEEARIMKEVKKVWQDTARFKVSDKEPINSWNEKVQDRDIDYSDYDEDFEELEEEEEE